jgi:hypothetical protein
VAFAVSMESAGLMVSFAFEPLAVVAACWHYVAYASVVSCKHCLVASAVSCEYCLVASVVAWERHLAALELAVALEHFLGAQAKMASVQVKNAPAEKRCQMKRKMAAVSVSVSVCVCVAKVPCLESPLGALLLQEPVAGTTASETVETLASTLQEQNSEKELVGFETEQALEDAVKKKWRRECQCIAVAAVESD